VEGGRPLVFRWERLWKGLVRALARCTHSAEALGLPHVATLAAQAMNLASFCVVHRGAICAPVDDIIPLIEYFLTEDAMFARLAHGAALHGMATQVLPATSRRPTHFQPSFLESKWHPMTWRAVSAKALLRGYLVDAEDVAVGRRTVVPAGSAAARRAGVRMVGPCSHCSCSPRHIMPFNSRNEGSNAVG